jgi:ferredoxin-NADP reductase
MSNNEGRYQKIKIKQIREEITGFKTIEFEEGHHITYKAGQYLTFIHKQDVGEVRRSYSICSSPVLKEPLSIGVKRIENGLFSRILVDKAKPGDFLETAGSGGLFVLPDENEDFQQLFFFASGSGITPILSLIKTALHTYRDKKIVLVYSNSSPDKAVYLEVLRTIGRQFPERFHLELLFSNSPDLSKARLHRDLLLRLLTELANLKKGETFYYVCGPEAYMRMCIYTLQESGVPASNIKKENFIINTVAKRDMVPPDKAQHNVHLFIGDKEHHFTVKYPDTILKSAQKNKINLPYSCEAGRCGNCVAICTKGSVWHSYNEVLTEKELKKGMILTCVGHPVDGDVDLRFDQ